MKTRTRTTRYGAIIDTDKGEVEINRVACWVSVDDGDDADERLANALERKARHIRLHGVDTPTPTETP